MAGLIEKDLSYKIVGSLFGVYNELGGGYQEKYYQRAIREAFRENKLTFAEQVLVPLQYKSSSIGRYFLDFVVEGKIVLEVKAANTFYPRDIRQVLAYLKSTGIELGILANFSKKRLEFKRILKGN